MQSLSHGANQQGGLCHLVEAATALSSLVKTSPYSSFPPNSAITKSAPTPSVVSVSDDESAEVSKKSPTSKRREIFPQRLLTILNDSSLSDVVSWLPHGRSFVIIRPDTFASQVLPKYLPSDKSSTKYPSFTRKLNRWGFRQATRGPDTGAFYHPLFNRDKPELCLGMVCQKSRKGSIKRSTKSSNKKEQDHKTSQDTPSTPKKRAPSPPQGSSLPPKKRKMMTASSEPMAEEKPAIVTPPPEQKVAAPSLVTTATAPSFPIILPSASMARGVAPLSALVPTDPEFVAATLKVRDNVEKMAVAKCMLYDAYLKALDGR